MKDYIKKIFEEYVAFAEECIEKYSLRSKIELQSTVADAMDYSLEAGGKRIRPVLVQAFCKLCGGDTKKTAAPAAAI